MEQLRIPDDRQRLRLLELTFRGGTIFHSNGTTYKVVPLRLVSRVAGVRVVGSGIAQSQSDLIPLEPW